MLRFDNIQIDAKKVKYSDSEAVFKLLQEKVCDAALCGLSDILSLKIIKRSIDARKKPDVKLIFSVAASLKNEEALLRSKKKNISKYIKKEFVLPKTLPVKTRPVVVGFGPCGIAAAYVLARCGANPLIIERGGTVDERKKAVSDFWDGSDLDPECNVQFGEGGAGAFSDGKLNTGNKDKDGLQKAILKVLYEHGAGQDILYDQRPHIGTDKLTEIVKNLRNTIISLGGEFLFNTRFEYILTAGSDKHITGIIVNNNGHVYDIKTDCLILAIGHSARDTIRGLYNDGAALCAKPFAVGYRVIHPQSFINNSQYGEGLADKYLPAANYKLTYTAASSRPVYSFCMCPGGFVVNAQSQNGHLCVNGMSYSARDGKYANSAIVMGIDPNELEGDDPLKGMYFQQKFEKKTFEAGNGCIPVCSMEENRFIEVLDAFKGDIVHIPDMIKENKILPDYINADFIEGMKEFDRLIPGFYSKAVVSGIESRTSSPVRILRNKDYSSVSIPGLYPCGEGAGYAGGIMSAAMDGVRCSLSYLADKQIFIR